MDEELGIYTIDIEATSIGTGWTFMNHVRLRNWVTGGQIQFRIGWRRTAPNTFEFRAQWLVTWGRMDSLTAGGSLRWSFYDLDGNRSTVVTNNGNIFWAEWPINTQINTVFRDWGGIQSRTMAQVGNHTILRFSAQIRISPLQFSYNSHQIGSNTWFQIFAGDDAAAGTVASNDDGASVSEHLPPRLLNTPHRLFHGSTFVTAPVGSGNSQVGVVPPRIPR